MALILDITIVKQYVADGRKNYKRLPRIDITSRTQSAPKLS